MVKFQYQTTHYFIDYEIDIPFTGFVDELAYLLLNKFKIPPYISPDLLQELDVFIARRNRTHLDSVSSQYNRRARQGEVFEDVIKKWEIKIKDEMSEFGDKRCASDEELFATAYHRMVHSPALETILNLEHQYADIVRTHFDDTEKQVSHLSLSQTDQMNDAIDRLSGEDGVTNEVTINQLVSQQYEDQTFLRVQLTSELDTIKEAQRREYRGWLMNMVEQSCAISTPSSPLSPKLPPSMNDPCPPSNRLNDSPIFEESFTIHLGSQLKQMHNIRVLSANIMDFCEASNSHSKSMPMPEKKQTALCLYSNDLSGIVLMADNIISSQVNKDFRDICQRSSDFHFSSVDGQLDNIARHLQLHHDSTSTGLNKDTQQQTQQSRRHLLQPGDCYVTRHSNLAQEHVVFHLVTTASTTEPTRISPTSTDSGGNNNGGFSSAMSAMTGGDINSRHAVVLGLRNVLKAACAHDVTTITVPLLLSYEMGEEMTVLWCEKRAELVYKCVKGFMIEMASWGGSELKNLQFMLPPGISWDVFQSLTDMLPRIFKVSNPLILQTSSKN